MYQKAYRYLYAAKQLLVCEASFLLTNQLLFQEYFTLPSSYIPLHCYAASLVQAFQQLLVLCCLVQAMNTLQALYRLSSSYQCAKQASYSITTLVRSKLLIQRCANAPYAASKQAAIISTLLVQLVLWHNITSLMAIYLLLFLDSLQTQEYLSFSIHKHNEPTSCCFRNTLRCQAAIFLYIDKHSTNAVLLLIRLH